MAPRRPRLVALLLVGLGGLLLPGCAGPSRSYGESGIGEQWMILDAGNPDLPKHRAELPRQHGYGWATQVAEVTSDGVPKDVIVGPIAYAGDDPADLEISYSIFADPPLTGRLRFEAVPEAGCSLSDEWASGLERRVTMTKFWRTNKVIVPQLGVPTESLTIRWITDGPTDPSALEGDQP